MNFCIETVTVTIVQATFVMATFVHIRNVSFVTYQFVTKLKVGSFNPLQQMPTVIVTFIQATFVLATFVNIRNFSAATDPFFTKFIYLENILYDQTFIGPQNSWTQHVCGPKSFFRPKIYLIQNLLSPIFFGSKKV